MSTKLEWEQEEAKRLRKEGKSINEIARILGVSKGSVSAWVRQVEITDEQRAHFLRKKSEAAAVARQYAASINREKSLAKRKAYQEAGRAKAREQSLLHAIGCTLLWAEGAKTRSEIHFVNSDPHMMRLFITFLRQELHVPEEAMSIHIHCHVPEDIPRIERFWLDWLGLPDSALRTTQIKKGSDTRKNRLENGVCGLRVYNGELMQHIYGAIQEYGGFENPEWLF
ncbi:MAG: hypothetical protein OHK0046_03110 [Anaerolineae bacterium]